MAECATSFSTRACSSILISPASSSALGSPTTTPREAAFLARLQNAGGPCRHTHHAEGRNVGRGSNRRWMKLQWQVMAAQVVWYERSVLS